jgi:hypothetical protein
MAASSYEACEHGRRFDRVGVALLAQARVLAAKASSSVESGRNARNVESAGTFLRTVANAATGLKIVETAVIGSRTDASGIKAA